MSHNEYDALQQQHRTLLQQYQTLQEQQERTEMELKLSRTALVNAQLTVQLLTRECEVLLDQLTSQAETPNQSSIEKTRQTLANIHDTSWITELRVDALGRGFSEGYRYALSHKHTIQTQRKALEHYKTLTDTLWPAPSLYWLGRWGIRAQKSTVSRFEYDPERQEDPFFFDDAGSFVEYSAYAEIKLQLDVAKEELAGYRWLLADPLGAQPPKHFAQHATKARVRRPKKPGMLRIQYGQNGGERDLFVLYGDGVPSCDRALALYTFGSPRMEFDYERRTPKFGHTLVEELAARGYDLSTLRFSICKKPTTDAT